MAPASNVDCKQAEKTTSRGPVCEHSVNSNSHNNNIGNHVSVPPVSHSHPRKKKNAIERYWNKTTRASGDEMTEHKVLALARDANTEWHFQRPICKSVR